MTMRVKEVADLIGISTRTLHHYDQIGLLSPQKTTSAGYRLYSEENLKTLQQILFFKELGFPLKEIKEIIFSPSFNQQEALLLQLKMLVEKRNNIDKMIKTVDKTIKHMSGEIKMTNEEKFEGINFSHKAYEQEARKRWGNQSVEHLNEKIKIMSKAEQNSLSKRWVTIFKKLALFCDYSAESQDVQAIIKEWYDFLNENFKNYSLDEFYGLGLLYMEDERFTKNIEQYGAGLTRLMSEAMKVFVDNQK
ncbi:MULTISPECIES: MerR family transcriptional regulator [Oceanobacillus]|uniref:MerR family transcriptional regulator n=1 Tax=Oceanobacillus neutriphilus TaxID=531815 RepID=A0ABQ2NS27_9BACI|nr:MULTISPECIES: MerR family transcriptional regulator [Oceanobacillus]GGP08819.1 MerR family transcriptional regulator [Oceanobacillus neutriphilus]